MRILTNVAALNSWRNLQSSGNAMSKNLERLSSGMRINRASDDAAGLTISEKMRAQIRGLNQAQRNAQDGISMIQTAEGAMSEIQNMLQRMRELAVQSSSDGLGDEDRGQIQKEVDQLAKQITDISNFTQFNSKKLLTGKYTDVTIQTGANAAEKLSFSISALDAKSLGVAADNVILGDGAVVGSVISANGLDDKATYELEFTAAVDEENPAKLTLTVTDEEGNETTIDASGTIGVGEEVTFTVGEGSIKIKLADTGLDTDGSQTFTVQGAKTGSADNKWVASTAAGISVNTKEVAEAAVTTIEAAINQVSGYRSELGALQNRLEYSIANTQSSTENLQAAESRIRDVDMAQEMTAFTKNQILVQAGTAMLAQANQLPQSVLKLLG
jgi:flagellin